MFCLGIYLFIIIVVTIFQLKKLLGRTLNRNENKKKKERKRQQKVENC
jgi:hypothetical protein